MSICQWYLLVHAVCAALLILWGVWRIYPMHVENGRPKCKRRYFVVAALAAVFAPLGFVIVSAYEIFFIYDVIYRGKYEPGNDTGTETDAD